MTVVAFSIPGTPVGKGRPKFARRGNHVTTYTPEKTASYENLVKVKALEAMQGQQQPIDGPVCLELTLLVTPPASWSKKKTADALCGFVFPTSKPDIDNVLKGICDAMNEVVFRDDKQVCDVHIVKRYAEIAEARVKLIPETMDAEKVKRDGWNEQKILVVSLDDRRLDIIDREFVKQMGERLSAYSALVFAFNVSRQCYDRPVMNRLASPAIGSGKGLAGLDGAAQAGMIRSEVKALGKLAESMLIARISPRSEPCSCRSACCGGSRTNTEWFDAIGALTEYAKNGALAGTNANGMMRQDYVARYFAMRDQRVSLERLAEKYDLNRQTVGAHYGKLSKVFKEIESRAQNAIEDKLREIGVVGAE
ncbi:hypothetical protein DFQ28_005162 [Apophysomyces sp. BC1034]|nr:hypothetical protein DFQ28_005162 [Apophysomyces sp. BC1034]